MGESNFRIELEEVWVPKDVGELEGLLLTIQNEPGKKILKHKIQQVVKEKAERRKNLLNNWNQNLWDDDHADHEDVIYADHENVIYTDHTDHSEDSDP